jgi:hypothetical protein
MEVDAHNRANLRRFARVTHFAERTEANSVTNFERMHITISYQDLLLF